jgi:hypothetical protein
VSLIARIVAVSFIVAGVVIGTMLYPLLGAVMVIGGVSAIGWSVVPDAIDRVAEFLSTGTFRRYRG